MISGVSGWCAVDEPTPLYPEVPAPRNRVTVPIDQREIVTDWVLCPRCRWYWPVSPPEETVMCPVCGQMLRPVAAEAYRDEGIGDEV